MDDEEHLQLAAMQDEFWWCQALRNRLMDSLVEAGPIPRGVILDAGCAGGVLMRKLKTRFVNDVVGVDIHAPSCRLATDAGLTVIVGSVERLPFVDAGLTAIVCADVLCHRSADDVLALAEFNRCLRPGGWLLVNVPAFAWLLSSHDRRVHNVRRYTAPRLAALLRSSGFDVISVSYWNLLLFPVLVARRLLLPSRSSEVEKLPAIVNRVLLGVTELERKLQRGRRLPFGSSVLALARRPERGRASARA